MPNETHPRWGRAAVVAVAAALGVVAFLPAAAQADSIVHIKNYNVWVSEPDGSRHHQVTTDGTAEWPYRSPSQSDDGTIAASHRNEIVRMRQNGRVLNRIDPPALVNSVSHPVDGPPFGVSISPDGTKIAYSLAGYTCPIGAECMARAASSVTWADRFTPRGTFAEVTYGDPTWVGGNRLLVTGGYLHHINLVDIAPGSTARHWFDDQDYFGDSSDMGEGAVSRDGKRVAAIHGYDGEWPGSVRRMIWFNTVGDPRSGAVLQPKPAAVCTTGPVRGMHSPTWSPDGRSLAVEIPEGIEIDVAPTRSEDCGLFNSRVTIPGGSEPEWGPAPVAPEPLPGPGPGGDDAADNGGGSADVPRGGPETSPPPGTGGRHDRPGGVTRGGITWQVQGSAKLRTTLRSGVKLRVTGLQPRKKLALRLEVGSSDKRRLKLASRTVAKVSARASKTGSATVRLRFTKSAVKKAAKAKSLKVTVRGGGLGNPVFTLR